jgi:hypothetical protein
MLLTTGFIQTGGFLFFSKRLLEPECAFARFRMNANIAFSLPSCGQRLCWYVPLFVQRGQSHDQYSDIRVDGFDRIGALCRWRLADFAGR